MAGKKAPPKRGKKAMPMMGIPMAAMPMKKPMPKKMPKKMGGY